MLFPTYEFLLFFIIIFPLSMSLKPYIKGYKWFLITVNLIFYGCWGIKFLGLLLGSVAINYLIIKALSLKHNQRKIICVCGVIFNLAYLGLFKYYNFFTNSLLEVFNNLQIQFSLPVMQIIIPIGISFYTFRLISHLIDSYGEKIANPPLLDYCIYITYFPQILSGPIARAEEFYYTLNKQDKYQYKIESVIILILSGLFKKYTLASFLFQFSQLPFSLPDQYSRVDLILASLAYSCLIYVDFSGYSDLANATSSLLGFKPVKNFNMPYQSRSLKEFWHRWHISLSLWLRDYLYIPLGGNKYGKSRKYLNLFLTMLIGGFWHGAGLNFIFWGAIHATGLIINHLWTDLKKKFNFIGDNRLWIEQFFLWLITFIFITFSWIFFNTSNWETSLLFIQGIFTSEITTSQFNIWQLYLVIFTVLFINFYGEKTTNLLSIIISKISLTAQIILTFSCSYIILMLGPNTVPPFIYFNF
jgi:alginate O-acetyltransferase complex protein AlgI